MSSVYERATDFDKEIANILLEIPNLITADDEVPLWSSKRRRTAREIVAHPQQFSPAEAAGDSEFETPSCSQRDGEKLVTDDHPRIDEENHCEIKDGEGCGLEVEPPKTNVRRIKFKPPRPPDSPAINNGDQCSLRTKEDVDLDATAVETKKNTFHESGKGELAEVEGGLVREWRTIKAEKITMLEDKKPHKDPAKRKSHQEMRKEVLFWEQHKSLVLECIQKVEDYLEKQKALNLQLKDQKLKADTYCSW
ncbi:hypothetical protein V6N12_018600 [Hibiscus sabdariffa]|uniref:Uncharacterized protein n=1 Tax=Hibiscus sabdariffa TaxID=183260 RepID=A0ABR2A960_9ROSI